MADKQTEKGRQLGETEPKAATLTLDANQARITVPSDRSGLLLGFLKESEIHCQLQEGKGHGMDVIDLGKPSESDRQRIRQLFQQWQETNR